MLKQVFVKHCHTKRRLDWHQPCQSFFWYNINYAIVLYFCLHSIQPCVLMGFQGGSLAPRVTHNRSVYYSPQSGAEGGSRTAV